MGDGVKMTTLNFSSFYWFDSLKFDNMRCELCWKTVQSYLEWIYSNLSIRFEKSWSIFIYWGKVNLREILNNDFPQFNTLNHQNLLIKNMNFVGIRIKNHSVKNYKWEYWITTVFHPIFSRNSLDGRRKPIIQLFWNFIRMRRRVNW